MNKYNHEDDDKQSDNISISINRSTLKNIIKYVLIGGIAIVLVIGAVVYSRDKKEKDYRTDKYTKVSECSNEFNDDFNVSISNLYSDTSFSNDLDDIRNNQSSVEQYMKKLKNPPDEYRDAYESVKDLPISIRAQK